MSRLDKLKAVKAKNKMQDLEQDVLFFYDYLLFLKNIEKEDSYLKYVGIYVAAQKLLIKNGLTNSEHPVQFKESNMITNYIKLSKMFKLNEFNGTVFNLDEIKLVRNQWRLL